ncbi:hypothetical protein PR048_029356 [Dryococelus australis]|uniref:PiggyBac transposable element-derived protein domain-containing protein n=1 Tax=Dryococelus australis TaxID=614101 RepID=A0ABQ9GD58_9NEOP|nr:hypothetical protein PR048_029356 [Dryococelus australis]
MELTLPTTQPEIVTGSENIIQSSEDHSKSGHRMSKDARQQNKITSSSFNTEAHVSSKGENISHASKNQTQSPVTRSKRKLETQSSPQSQIVGKHTMPKPDEKKIIGSTKPKRVDMKWENLPFCMQDKFEPTEKELPMPSKINSPLEYFMSFFPEEISDIIVEQTILYSTQVTQAKGGTAVTATKDDIADFIAIEILMGVVDMSCYLDYWSNSSRYDKIASLTSLEKRFIHFVNNDDENDDRYLNIRPLLDIIRERCLHLDHESRFSIDEMMIPYKGRKAGSGRQYLPSKQKKNNGDSISGIIYDFLPYGGDDTFRYRLFAGEEEQLFRLVHYLRNEFCIFSLGTIRTNRISRCDTIADDKSLKKKKAGSFCNVVSDEFKVSVVRWIDNKTVTLVCSYADAYRVSSAKKYCKDTSEGIDGACPYVVKEYNTHMGGVYWADMLIALYRTPLKTRRWHLEIFAQLLDICVTNPWLLMRRELQLRKMKHEMSLKAFRIQLFESLTLKKRVRGRPSKTTSNVQRIKTLMKPRPSDEVRLDMVGHFPMQALCVKVQTSVECTKCKLGFCMKEKSNCFVDFHTQN